MRNDTIKPHPPRKIFIDNCVAFLVAALCVVSLTFIMYTTDALHGFMPLLPFPWLVVLMWGYLLPTMIAHKRGHEHMLPICVLNLLLGWSLIGWVGALVWAAMPSEEADRRAQAASVAAFVAAASLATGDTTERDSDSPFKWRGL
jgi:Superinfection immunity protein